MVKKFVVFEGSDGSGKTSVVEKVIKLTGYNHFNKMPHQYESFKDTLVYGSMDPFSAFLFYCSGLHAAGLEINDLIDRGNGVIVDRYLESLRIYHEIFTGRDLSKIMKEIPFFQPDLTIILSAPDSVLNHRISLRSYSRIDESVENNPQIISKVNARFKSLRGPNTFHFDSSLMSIDEIVSQSLVLIKS